MRKLATYLAFVAILTSSFVTVLNTSMTRIISPQLADVYGLSYSELTWVYSSYQIIYAVLLPVFGQLGDKRGRRICLLAGLVVFGIGSFLSGLAPNYVSLVLFRVIQGIGAAAIFPSAVVLAVSLFPPEHRGKVMGAWGMAVSMGSVAGPSLGGIIVNYLGWKYVFFINVPFVILGLISISMWVRSDSAQKESLKFDFLGLAILTAIIVTVVTSLQGGAENGWSPLYLSGLLASVVLIPVFVWAEKKAPEPLVDLAIMRTRSFLSGLYCGGMHLVVIHGTQFLLPLFMAEYFGMDAFEIGIFLIPQAAIRFVISPLAGVLADKYTSRFPVAIGLVLRTAALLLLSFLTEESSLAYLALALLLDGSGAALIWSPTMNAVLNSAPPEHGSSVTGVFNMMRFIMASVGVVLVGLVLDKFSASEHIVGKPLPGYLHSYLALAALTALGLVFVRFLEERRPQPVKMVQDAGRADE